MSIIYELYMSNSYIVDFMHIILCNCTWFKHIVFMKKRIWCGLKCDKNPLLEGLFTGEPTHTHTITQQHEHIMKIQNNKSCD